MASIIKKTETVHLHARGRVTQLVIIFLLWKTLLLLLAAFCPGPGYDTSALVLLDTSFHRHDTFRRLPRSDHLTLNLFRWDAFYFVTAAQRGHVFEQEWAFSWAYSHLLKMIGQYVSTSEENSLRPYIVAGVVLSTIFHLLSVLVLYRLLSIILPQRQQSQVAFVASVLHILTPASLFYSAPYAEALFSLLNLTGMMLYAQSKAMAASGRITIKEHTYKFSSGLIFASATLMRSNGLLSGLIFVYDIAEYLPRIASRQPSLSEVKRIIVTCISGASIAIGFFVPQYLAYNEFCGQSRQLEPRPWCEQRLPSIYSWVQRHYWNVGLFRYWTIPNLPLFLLAAPMLWLMLKSSVTVLRSYGRPLREAHVPQVGETNGSSHTYSWSHCLPELALPQLVLAIAAATSFHVQIVNRIASAYPTWYVMIASWLVDKPTAPSKGRPLLRDQWVVRGLIIYALVQGMLFSNFLPPA